MLRRNSQKEKQMPGAGPRKRKIRRQVISIKHPCLGVLLFLPSDWLSWKCLGIPLQFSLEKWKLNRYDKISLNKRWLVGYDKLKTSKRAHIKDESVTAHPRGPRNADFKATASQEQYLIHTSFFSKISFEEFFCDNFKVHKDNTANRDIKAWHTDQNGSYNNKKDALSDY